MSGQPSVAELNLAQLRALVAAGPPYDPDLLAALEGDPRAGAHLMHRACLRKQGRAVSEKDRLDAMMAFERQAMANGFPRVAGVDEAGRGPLAGPIVAAAVVLAQPLPGLNDSKCLTAAQREGLFAALSEGAHTIGTAVIEPDAIDRRGIQSANYAAMAQAAARLDPPADFLLVDGFIIHGCALPQKHLIKGDRRSASIAAASIVAKVTRDRIMDGLHRRYPEYGFASNKGYGTRAHIEALQRRGPCPVHRRSFAPIASAIGAAGADGSLF